MDTLESSRCLDDAVLVETVQSIMFFNVNEMVKAVKNRGRGE